MTQKEDLLRSWILDSKCVVTAKMTNASKSLRLFLSTRRTTMIRRALDSYGVVEQVLYR